MNAHSFERELRNLETPAADAEARSRARLAALAEFDRLHLRQEPVQPATSPRASGWKWFAWPRGGAMWGGVATACLAVVAVSLFLRTPAEKRVVGAPVELIAEADSAAPSQPEAPARAQATPAQPTPAQPNQPQTSTVAPQGNMRSEAAPQSSVQLKTERAVAPSPVLDMPVPAAATSLPPAAPMAPPPPAVRSREADDSAAEVQFDVRTSQARSFGLASGAAVAGNDLQEVSVTGSRTVRPPKAKDVPGRFQHFETNTLKRVADEPVSTFSADVDTASYSIVRRQINEGELPPQDAVRVEEMINYFDYAWPAANSASQPFRPSIAVSDSPWHPGRKLVHIGIKGFELPARERPDANLVLLLDVSGSMNEPDKLPLVQQSMAMLLETLKPSDTVAIVVYAGAAGQVLPPTRVRERETILRALYALQPGGSTAGAEGIRLAYRLAERNFRRDGVNRILLATDGDFNVGITDLEQLRSYVARERDKGVFLSVLGFGAGNYRDDMAQMLAQNGNGVAAYIDTAAEARKVLVQQATASLFTIARDVKLQVEFNPATVSEYRLIGYETRALNEEDFNNDKVDAGEVGSGHAVTAIYEITPVGARVAQDERRYAGEPAPAAPRGRTSEYGFLKIRYKLPDGGPSRLIERPIRVDAGVPATLRDDVNFSTAVAGFGQLLRDDSLVGSWNYADVIRLAQSSVGADPHGYRAEFVQLARRAQALEEGE